MTNNEEEYEALIAVLQLARHLEVSILEIFSDSQLVAKQILGEYKVMNDRMAAFKKITQELLRYFTSWSLYSIKRSVNHWADALSKLVTSTSGKHVNPVYIKDLTTSSINLYKTGELH